MFETPAEPPSAYSGVWARGELESNVVKFVTLVDSRERLPLVGLVRPSTSV